MSFKMLQTLKNHSFLFGEGTNKPLWFSLFTPAFRDLGYDKHSDLAISQCLGIMGISQ